MVFITKNTWEKNGIEVIIVDNVSTEEIIFQYFILGYRIDAYFLKHKLAIEVDERGHNNRDLESEIERQKALEKELDCKFIRINPARENFNIFNEINRIHHHIVKSKEKNLLDNISNTLLNLKLKKNNSIKTKCFRWIVKKIFPEFY